MTVNSFFKVFFLININDIKRKITAALAFNQTFIVLDILQYVEQQKIKRKRNL